ncbi:hypothetical protein GOBAR_AA40192 [Gossypium barbadense]|uniref:AMP-dependent synthetase/ligase domain-containing protein n=1 Tax=Gossypium barbadense TaxID=3634 RepID=A0A2P5VNV8_GOSBA|nr:hypothetical protein GOBAR_AA40192 [Gossypium barbadense]
MYTSGTTGDPKGVMISNCSVVTPIAGVKHLVESVNEELTEKDVYLSYLPLAHIFDRMIEEFFISRGALMGFWRGDVKLLADDIGELKSISSVNSGLGGNVRLILSSAAPLSDHIEEFLRGVAYCHVLQGYGLTETCAGTFVSLPNELSMLGPVGPPERRYFQGSTNVKTSPRRYSSMDGDVGEWQPNESMKIIDRKKNIFKLSQGEYVAVENLENVFGLASVIDSVMPLFLSSGTALSPSSLLLLTPRSKHLKAGLPLMVYMVTLIPPVKIPRPKEYVVEELSKIGKEKKLKGFEFIKAAHIDPVPFDMERNLLTPTYKKKRSQLLKHYQSVIDNLYKSANKPNARQSFQRFQYMFIGKLQNHKLNHEQAM